MNTTERKLKVLKGLKQIMEDNEFKITSGYDGDMYLEFEGADNGVEFSSWSYEINKKDISKEIDKIEAQL